MNNSLPYRKPSRSSWKKIIVAVVVVAVVVFAVVVVVAVVVVHTFNENEES